MCTVALVSVTPSGQSLHLPPVATDKQGADWQRCAFESAPSGRLLTFCPKLSAMKSSAVLACTLPSPGTGSHLSPNPAKLVQVSQVVHWLMQTPSIWVCRLVFRSISDAARTPDRAGDHQGWW